MEEFEGVMGWVDLWSVNVSVPELISANRLFAASNSVTRDNLSSKEIWGVVANLRDLCRLVRP